MPQQATFLNSLLTALLLASPTAVLAVDLANLPTISHGEISLNNDLDSAVTMEVTPQGCPMQRVTVRAHSSLVVGCAGAQKVKVSMQWMVPDGRVVPSVQDLPVDTHYIFTWSDETKSYTKLASVFDAQGHPIR